MNKWRSTLSIATFLLILTSTTAMAQKLFTHDDLQPGGATYAKMTPPSLGAKWWGNTLTKTTRDKCVAIDLKASRRSGAVANTSDLKVGKTLFTLSSVNNILSQASLDTLKSLGTTSLPYADKTLVLVSGANKRVLADWSCGKVVWSQLRPQSCQAEDWNKTSRHLAYVKDHNLFVADANGEVKQLSQDGSREIVYGQAVHRSEWGINKGIFWSPDGEMLAYYRMDQSMVTDYPQVDINNRIAQYKPDKYPMAGMTSHEVSIGIYNVKTQQNIWLDLGDKKGHYFTGISWAPDNKTIYVTILNRDQNHDEMWAFSATDGKKLRKIYQESSDKYVEPEHAPIFLPWDNNRFVYQTVHNGYSHLLLFDTTGKQLADLTPGNYVVTSVMGFNPKTHSVIVATTECHDLQHNLYAINVETGKRQLLDNGKGVHNGTISPDGSLVLDSWSSPNVKRQYDVINTSTAALTPLYRPNDPWEGYTLPTITSGSFKAEDGVTDLYYRLITPPDFDPTKKYPTIVYLYGGPHTRLVEASWGYNYRGWEIYMAQRGYVMFVMDNRGSSERGQEFENVTHLHLGDIEMRDQLRGVEFLKSLPYVDANRMGVHGWSFGGFMTTNLMVSYPDVFKVAVAGGPVIDWNLYEVMYGERYMSTPQKNPDGYKASNLCLKAGNLKGRLKIIFGYNDPVCVPQHTLSFARACANAGVQIDLFTYPNSEHNMTGHDRIHLYQQISRYFDDFLK